MVKFLLALHLVFAVFIVGPLVWAAKTAGRGVRKGDGALTAAAVRTLRIYSIASILVVAAGMGLMSQKEHGQKIADIGDTWIWLSLLLWVLAIGVVHAITVPTLTKAGKRIDAEESVVALTIRVAVSGGVVAVLFVAIVVLMVYRPGS